MASLPLYLLDIYLEPTYTITHQDYSVKKQMNQIIMSVPQTQNSDRLQVSVHIQAEVVAAEVARREANFWLLEHIGNLLRAENPELVLGDHLIWRLDIMLTSPNSGSLGLIGRLELDATTGKVLADESLLEELPPRAYALATN